MKFRKLFTMDCEQDHASERIINKLTSKLPTGKPTRIMREWLTAGFLLDEFGYGLKEFLLSTDCPGVTRKERLNRLTQYLELCLKDSPMKIKEEPVTSEETPVSKPARSEPAKPKRKGRQSLAD